MSVIKDIRECSIQLKSIIVGIIVLACFWAGIIYQYHSELFQLSDFKFCMLLLIPSILWYFMELIKFVPAMDALQTVLKVHISKTEYWIMIAADALIYLIIFSLILILSHVTFRHFMYLAFSLHFLFMLIGIAGYIFASMKAKRQ